MPQVFFLRDQIALTFRTAKRLQREAREKMMLQT
jgi:hypothetical protein